MHARLLVPAGRSFSNQEVDMQYTVLCQHLIDLVTRRQSIFWQNLAQNAQVFPQYR